MLRLQIDNHYNYFLTFFFGSSEIIITFAAIFIKQII